MSSEPIKIATYNVNGIRAHLSHLIEWLKREQPDVACLQEIKIAHDVFPLAEIHMAGYGALWKGQPGFNGVAILAKGEEPHLVLRELPGDPGDDHSRYVEAKAHGVHVACLYLPNGNPQPGPKFDYKLAWFERLIERARVLVEAHEPVVMAGDYNVIPTDDDVYDVKSFKKDALMQPATREAWQRLLAQGWTDALRVRHPGTRIYTFWDFFRQHFQRDAGLRIDHLLLNRNAAPHLRDANVDRWVRGEPKPSDHAPTWVTLGIPR